VFNDGLYYERACANELLASVESSRAPRGDYDLPPGTQSQMVWYFEPETMRRVALVHQYLLPDGTVGGSGRPDPKRIIIEGIVLYC